MKINMYEHGGNLEGGFTSPGMTLTGPLLLSGNPTIAMEAVHKQYVDTVFSTLNANNFNTGTMPGARMPALTGDINCAQGTTAVTLSATGVVAGDYPKVTVDAKGRVTAGTGLVDTDIPSFNWNKITTGKPTTLLGYGITDAISKTAGGTVTGYIVLNGNPTADTQAATKQYVDNAMASSSGFAIGDVTTKPVTTTPSGFLRCNGAEISKTTYAALYGVIGDTFGFPLTPGAGQPWKQQYQTNVDQSADLAGWTTGPNMQYSPQSSTILVTKNRVYSFSGYINGSWQAVVYTTAINSDGTLTGWTSTTSLPGILANTQPIVTKNRVYLIGGTNGSGATSTVYTAVINSDGTLGTWSTATSLPVTITDSQSAVTKNYVYLFGGVIAGSYSNVVYMAPINSDGTLGTWTTGNPMPGVLSKSQVVVTKNRVYMLGGETTGAVRTNAVYTAPINADGTIGTWTTGTSLPVPLSSSQIFVTRNRVYLFGGMTTSSYISTVYTAPINADGTLGTWTTGTPFPIGIGFALSFATKNHLFVIGGFNANTSLWSAVCYSTPILGGLNDYSQYYDGTMIATDPNNFKVPDYSAAEKTGLYYFIKY